MCLYTPKIPVQITILKKSQFKTVYVRVTIILSFGNLIKTSNHIINRLLNPYYRLKSGWSWNIFILYSSTKSTINRQPCIKCVSNIKAWRNGEFNGGSGFGKYTWECIQSHKRCPLAAGGSTVAVSHRLAAIMLMNSLLCLQTRAWTTIAENCGEIGLALNTTIGRISCTPSCSLNHIFMFVK